MLVSINKHTHSHKKKHILIINFYIFIDVCSFEGRTYQLSTNIFQYTVWCASVFTFLSEAHLVPLSCCQCQWNTLYVYIYVCIWNTLYVYARHVHATKVTIALCLKLNELFHPEAFVYFHKSDVKF